jgi:hypothetical protein
VPSGWQIRNERLDGAQMPKGIDYMDIRDDRNQTSITLRIILNAEYAGKFYLLAGTPALCTMKKYMQRLKGIGWRLGRSRNSFIYIFC